MKRKELLMWAIKGLSAEIDELEKTIRKVERVHRSQCLLSHF